MNKLKNFKIILLGFLIFLYISCTWTPSSVLPEYFRVIYIQQFGNETLEPGLSSLLTEKVIKEFELDGRLAVTDYVSKANGILFGNIIKYTKTPISYTEEGEIDGSILFIKISIKVRDIKTGRWLHDTYVEDKVEFYTKSEPVETEIEAQDRLMDKIAVKIVSIVIEGW